MKKISAPGDKPEAYAVWVQDCTDPCEPYEKIKALFSPPPDDCAFEYRYKVSCYENDSNGLLTHYTVDYRDSQGRIVRDVLIEVADLNPGVPIVCYLDIDGCLSDDDECGWKPLNLDANNDTPPNPPRPSSPNPSPLPSEENPPREPGGGGGGDDGGGTGGGGGGDDGGDDGGGTGGGDDGGDDGGGTGGGDDGGDDGGGTGGGGTGSGTGNYSGQLDGIIGELEGISSKLDELSEQMFDGNFGSEAEVNAAVEGGFGDGQGPYSLERGMSEHTAMLDGLANQGPLQDIKSHRYIVTSGGTCSASTTIFGRPFTLSLCEYEGQLNLLGNVLLGLVGLFGLIIVIRG